MSQVFRTAGELIMNAIGETPWELWNLLNKADPGE